MVRLARVASLVSLGWLGCSTPHSATPPDASGGTTGGSVGGAGASGAGEASVAGGGSGNGAGTGNAGGAGSASGSSAGGATAGAAGASGASGSAGTGGGGGGSAGDFCAARAGLAFCETFEEHPAGPAQAVGPWSPTMNGDGAAIEIDDAVAHSGKTSLKVRAGGFNAFYSLDVAAAAKSVPSALYVRVYVRIAEPMATGHNAYIVADTVKAPGQGNAFKIGEMNAMLMYNVGGDAHAALSNDAYYNDHKVGAAFTASEWGCLELTLSHEKPEIAVSLNGVDIPDMHHTDFPLDAYDALRFGFEKYAGPMRDVWYDDVALGTAPIGCK